MKTLLLLGGAGRLGRAIQRSVPAGWRIEAPSHRALPIEARSHVRRALAHYRPDAILNCAAMAHVDRCERQPERAWQSNCRGAAQLARVSGQRGLRLVHVSTDYVYGSAPRCRLPRHPARGAVQRYGRSKAAGEAAVRRLCPAATIARVSWLYSYQGEGFPGWVASCTGARLGLAMEQRSAPTQIDDAARCLWALVTRSRPLPGVVHVVGAEPATRGDWASAVLRGLGREVALHAARPAWDARRPRDTALRSNRLAAAGIKPPAGWRTHLPQLLDALQNAHART